MSYAAGNSTRNKKGDINSTRKNFLSIVDYDGHERGRFVSLLAFLLIDIFLVSCRSFPLLRCPFEYRRCTTIGVHLFSEGIFRQSYFTRPVNCIISRMNISGWRDFQVSFYCGTGKRKWGEGGEKKNEILIKVIDISHRS